MELPTWFWIFGAVFGAVIGSFLNVVIYRVPRGKSLWHPSQSFCPKCRHSLGPADLVPLVSYLLQRGKCRYCGVGFSSRYFFVELLNASIWGGLAYQALTTEHPPGRFVAYALAASTLVAIIFIDWELYIIPDQINAFLLAVGLGYNAYLYAIAAPEATTWGIPSALAGWLVGVGSLWGIALLGRVMFGKDAMGHGDIKMARGIGAVLFPTLALASFGLAVLAGAVLGILQVAWRKNSDSREGSPANAGSGAEDEFFEPESLGSLVRCGLGYLFAVDVVGLAIPRVSERWFGENPYAIEENLEDPEVERTMIPFGPYLAIGAIAAAVFEQPIRAAIDAYLRQVTGG